ncbi:hypothetical protein IIA_05643 [Bacillus cereus VD014]|uniref:Uncharacterized protein n=1 Tax=Bacillus cereus (strain VD014) TaxID=1053223 RepID=A0A9W5K1V8_BACC8|nr:hypothetical protein IIA_05643 [Bacillus cereus VD014]
MHLIVYIGGNIITSKVDKAISTTAQAYCLLNKAVDFTGVQIMENYTIKNMSHML